MSSDFHFARPERIVRLVPERKTILQIRTRPEDNLPAQAFLPGETETVDLTSGEPDYDALLEAVFRAERVQVW